MNIDPRAPAAGPHNPVPVTPARPPGSVRRTTTTDVTFPDGIGQRIVTDLRGRDLRTTLDGRADVLDEFAVSIAIEPWTATIAAVEGAAGVSDIDALVGLELTGSFAGAIAERFADDAARRSVFYSALEDLRGAQLVSGYAALRAGFIPDAPELAEFALTKQGDICTGWALAGSVMEVIRTTAHNPCPVGPVAPVLDAADPRGWHAVAPLTLHTVRRRRRTDVVAAPGANGLLVEHHLRDSHRDDDAERVMHEYLVNATFTGDERLTAIDADARVLPWDECPGALASAQQLVGGALSEFPARVRSELRGVSTCTHLNSTLRTLADAGALSRSLR